MISEHPYDYANDSMEDDDDSDKNVEEEERARYSHTIQKLQDLKNRFSE